MESDVESLPHIKRVSRIKHAILEKYFPPWAVILGSAHRHLCYFDCFAGPGRYELQGEPVDGSPIIAVRAAKHFLESHPDHTLLLALIEKDSQQVDLLKRHLKLLKPYPESLDVNVQNEDSETFVEDVLSGVSSLAPSFFMIDPYGHPLSVPVINKILERQRTECLITVMWYQINRDLGNAAMHQSLDRMFGDSTWREQEFMTQTGFVREKAFLDFFSSRLNAKFIWPFRIGFDHEDSVRGHRTKYYLLHVSNHPLAVLLMKQIMWPLGDEDGTFDFSGESWGVLISRTPKPEELRKILLREFAGREAAFDEILQKTWKLPFIEKHYREVIQKLRSDGIVEVTPVTSKKAGLRGRDLVRFPKANESRQHKR
jgi:three-Cys-motif partner protein